MTPVKCCNVCLSALQPSAQRCPSVQLQLGLHSRSLAARGRLPVSQQHQTTAAAAYNSLQGLPQQHIAAEPAAYTADAVAATSTGLPGPSSGSAAPAAVSLDVEYAHMRLAGGGEVSSPAWVALLDQHCSVLLKTYIQPEVPAGACWFGGVAPAAWAAAPALPQVVAALQQQCAGKMLLGHGLAKDLAALRMSHPQHLLFDTMTHPAFCNKAGNSRSLKQLAKAFLGINIQQQQQQQRQKPQQQHMESTLRHKQYKASAARKGQQQQRQQQQVVHREQHDPEEDAAAVMQLYQQVVLPSTYEGQVAEATQQLLLEIQQRQQQQED